MDEDQVEAAFEILLREIEDVRAEVQDGIAAAAQRADFGKVRVLTDQAESISVFLKEVETLRQAWKKRGFRRIAGRSARATPISGGSGMPGAASKPAGTAIPAAPRAHTGARSSPGLRTPEREYHLPILESLVELGGRAEMAAVIDRVYNKMKDRLNSFDFESIPSHPERPRWRNTAHWARSTLVEDGLMKNDSPTGIWEISEEGRRWLAEQKGQKA